MESRKITALLAALVILCAAVAQGAEQEQEVKASNTRTASCLLKVTCDPAILPLSFETIDYLMHSSGVAGAAAAEVLGPREEPYEYGEWFSIEPLSVAFPTPEPDDRPKPVAARPTYSRTPRRPEEEPEGSDARALLEMMRFEEKAKFQRRQYSEEDERKERRSRSRQGPGSGKIVQGPAPSGAEQSLLFQLQVDLEDREVKPAAEEFMNALIDNLRETLMAAADAYSTEVDQEFSNARSFRDWARERLAEALGLTVDTEADRRTRDQLEANVDLSGWRPEMSFADALGVLKNSVDPPLKMTVLWGDLLENAEIDQTTPINMDPLPEVRISKALDVLLQSVAAGITELGYEIGGGIITIATADSLPSAQRRLLQITHTETPMERLLERKNDLLMLRQNLEMDIAREEARRSAIEEQIHRIDGAVADRLRADPIALDLQRLVDLSTKQMEDIKKLTKDDNALVPQRDIDNASEKVTRAKIDLAKRREELSRSAGGSEVAGLTADLTQLMINLAVSRAEFEVVGRQLAETEEQLKNASAFDPEISQIRLAQEELEMAERRVSELRIRLLEGLRKPTVTVLGGT